MSSVSSSPEYASNSPFDPSLPVIRPGSPEFAALTGMTAGLI
jgi:hypothetical protein